MNQTISTISLGTGRYYLAIAADNNTTSFTGLTLATNNLRMVGVLTQESAFPLPSTMSPSGANTPASIPMFGLTQLATM